MHRNYSKSEHTGLGLYVLSDSIHVKALIAVEPSTQQPHRSHCVEIGRKGHNARAEEQHQHLGLPVTEGTLYRRKDTAPPQ